MGKRSAAAASANVSTEASSDCSQQAVVQLLDNSQRTLFCNPKCTGEALFLAVARLLDVAEKEYFALSFKDDRGQRRWVYANKSVSRQLRGRPWEFHWEVKFYPKDPSQLSDECARFQLYLQLRKDIYSGRLPASAEKVASLGALQAQAEVGDAPADGNDDRNPAYDDYLSHMHNVHVDERLRAAIELQHKQQKGLPKVDAEAAYIDACHDLAMYGVWLFPAKDDKSNAVFVGIGSAGISSYRDRLRIHRFKWQDIVRISFRRSVFSVRVKSEVLEKGSKEQEVSFRCLTHEDAKAVWKCGVEHHTFFRLMQPEDKPKRRLFPWGSLRFSYRGRTQMQTMMASQMFDKPGGTLQRPHSAALADSTSRQNAEHLPLEETVRVEQLARKQKKRATPTSDSKKTRRERSTASSSSSSSSDDEKRHYVMSTGAAAVARSPPVKETDEPQTTMSSWHETTDYPETVVTEVDEQGNVVTRTIRTQQVRHTTQRQTFQNCVLDDENAGYGVQSIEHTRESIEPLASRQNGGTGRVQETRTRTVAFEAPSQNGHSHQQVLDGALKSCTTVTSGNRTVETVTWEVDNDGVCETHVEHNIIIHGGADVDHDAELSAAILEATQLNPEMTIEKIEVTKADTTH